MALPALVSIDRTDNVFFCPFLVFRDPPRRLRPGWVLRGQPEPSDHVQQTVRGYHVCIRELHRVRVLCASIYGLHTYGSVRMSAGVLGACRDAGGRGRREINRWMGVYFVQSSFFPGDVYLILLLFIKGWVCFCHRVFVVRTQPTVVPACTSPTTGALCI